MKKHATVIPKLSKKTVIEAMPRKSLEAFATKLHAEREALKKQIADALKAGDECIRHMHYGDDTAPRAASPNRVTSRASTGPRESCHT